MVHIHVSNLEGSGVKLFLITDLEAMTLGHMPTRVLSDLLLLLHCSLV